MRNPRRFFCYFCKKERRTLGQRCPVCKQVVSYENWLEPAEPQKTPIISPTPRVFVIQRQKIAKKHDGILRTNSISSVGAA